MSTTLPPSTGSGFTNSPFSPDYIDLNSKDKINTTNASNPVQNSPINPGVILTKDSLDIPLIMQGGITNERPQPPKPELDLVLFTNRYVDTPEFEDKTITFYNELKSNLSPALQEQLKENEQKDFEDQDPNLIALDAGLQMQAIWIAMAETLAVHPPSNEPLSHATELFLDLPLTFGNNFAAFGMSISNHLDQYLATISSDDPGYDLLLNTSNQIKDALAILR